MILDRWNSKVPFYDEHPFDDGKLFVYRNSLGLVGVVRARSWEDAYSVVEDEFMPEASETVDELRREYAFERRYVKRNGVCETIEIPKQDGWIDNECFQECYGFRPNGPNKRDVLKHGIYAKDLNGERLDELTLQIAAYLELTQIDVPNIDSDPFEDYGDEEDEKED